jgi:hypothetical protein
VAGEVVAERTVSGAGVTASCEAGV